MAIPIINNWKKYFDNPDEGLGSSYERIILNNLIRKAINDYDVTSILESPAFGFTGLTGINLMDAALAGAKVYMEDDDPDRLELVQELWRCLGLKASFKLNSGFRSLDYPDKSIDMSFNFSALWFVEDLRAFLCELSRVSKKQIFVSVPNHTGIGFKGQLKGYSPELYPQLKPSYIDKPSIIQILNREGWHLCKSDYFDCPLWPDIGMSKEDFIGEKIPWVKALIKPKQSSHPPEGPPNCILDYYRGIDPNFPTRMMRYSLLERYAPQAFKRIWAHHYYMIFVPNEV